MREIKFRAMTKPPEDFADYHFTSTMVYGTALFVDPVNTWLCFHDPIQALAFDMTKHIVKPETVGQFIGLCDGNNKEIYEGDILDFNMQDYNGSDHLYRLPVIFAGACFGCAGNDKYGDPVFIMLDEIIANDDEAMVIGNVHQNPELLNG